tara:strand:+ start:15110 stop:16099 length:990 start_codon:yes stop_codon:yes gene_type:complete
MPTTQYDAALDLSLHVMRSDAATRRKVQKILKKLEQELLAKLSRGNLTEWGKARLTKQLLDSRQLIADNYREISDLTKEASEAVSAVAGAATTAALALAHAESSLPTRAVLDQLARGAVVQGAVQGRWWKRQADNTRWKYEQAVKQGIANSETNQQIIQRVRRELDVTRKSAATLVQTSMQTVMNNARTATFELNKDIIKGYRAVTALDGKVCPECIPLADLEWDKNFNPIGHGRPMPNYPLHFNCRCVIVPIVIDGPQGGQRASDEGPVKASLTFEKFLERKGDKYQNDVLGVGRAELWRKGKITLQDLTTGTNQPLSLKRLREKYAS